MTAFVADLVLPDVVVIVVVLAPEAVAKDVLAIVAGNVMVLVAVLVVLAVLEVVPVETYSLYIDERE